MYSLLRKVPARPCTSQKYTPFPAKNTIGGKSRQALAPWFLRWGKPKMTPSLAVQNVQNSQKWSTIVTKKHSNVFILDPNTIDIWPQKGLQNPPFELTLDSKLRPRTPFITGPRRGSKIYFLSSLLTPNIEGNWSQKGLKHLLFELTFDAEHR